MSFYEKLSINELRQLVLDRLIDESLVEKSDYERLFDNEVKFAVPDIDVLNFCTDGLNQFEDYQHDFGSDHLLKIKESYYKSNCSPTKKKYRIAKRLIIVAIIGIMLTALQLVSLAFGFNIFDYIFNWNDDADAVIVIGTSENEYTDEDYEYYYESTEQIPENISRLLPEKLLYDNKLDLAFNVKISNDERIYFSFNENTSQVFTISIFKSDISLLEKDDTPIRSETIKGIEYNYFRNIDMNRCIWEYNGYIYEVETSKTIEKLKDMVILFNHKKE